MATPVFKLCPSLPLSLSPSLSLSLSFPCSMYDVGLEARAHTHEQTVATWASKRQVTSTESRAKMKVLAALALKSPLFLR